MSRWLSLSNMTTAMQRLHASLLAAPVIWKGDYPYFIHPITDGVPRLDGEVLEAVINLIIERVDWENVDLILGIEAMGLPLCAPLSIQTGKPLVIARKRPYGFENEITIDQSTGYSKGAMYLNDINPGEKVLIVDDVLSTGGTMKAIFTGLETAKAEVAEVVTIIEKGEGVNLLRKQYPSISISSLVRLEMDGDKVVILD